MKDVIVTGASQGLGLELARNCLKKGYRVYSLERHISPALNALKGDNCFLFECDVTNLEKLQEVKNEVLKHTDKIDYIFNNAGVWLDGKRLLLEDPDFDFDIISKQYEINAVGVVKVVRTFIDMVKKGEGKCIVNLSSEAGSIGNAMRVCEYGYCMSKAAQNMATKLLQNAYPEIKFYAIHPGWMKTPQGYMGATDKYSPEQEPSDTAAKLVELAETKKYDFLYGDFNGNAMPW